MSVTTKLNCQYQPKLKYQYLPKLSFQYQPKSMSVLTQSV